MSPTVHRQGDGTLAIAAAVVALALATAACGDAPQDVGDATGVGRGDAEQEYVIVVKVTDDRRAFVERTESLAGWVADQTGTPTRVLTVQDDRAQITALSTGQAHAAYMSGGPAWIGWREFGLEAIAAEVLKDGGDTSYVAGLWVLESTGAERLEDLRGLRSCHTGELAGTGMLVPMGYLVQHGYVGTGGLDMDDIASLTTLRGRFFGQARIGGGYLGAFQCLSTGEGVVATGRDTAWDDFCGEDAEPWCRPRDEYRFLPRAGGPDPAVEGGGLARVPSHPVMVSPRLDARDRQALTGAFLSLADGPEGERILADVLGAAGLRAVTTEEHLGPYGDILEHVPGIADHLVGGP